MAGSLTVGHRVFGYCNGWFDLDSGWKWKTVEAIGRDWVVFREDGSGRIFLLSSDDPNQFLSFPQVDDSGE